MGGIAALAAVLVAGTLPAKAGLLEMIFGVPAQPRFERSLEMTVRPEGQMQEAKPKYGAGDEVRHVKAISIDPIANPDWYLIDPTLKPGDIVVLPQKVMVYSGSRGERRLGNFDDLKGARALSGRERERVRALTEYSRGSAANYTVIPAPELSVEPAPITARPEGPARPISISAKIETQG